MYWSSMGPSPPEQLARHWPSSGARGASSGAYWPYLGFVSESTLHESLAKHLEVPFVDLKHATHRSGGGKTVARGAGAPLTERWCCCKTLEGC